MPPWPPREPDRVLPPANLLCALQGRSRSLLRGDIFRRGPEGDAIRQQAVIREYLEEIRPTLPANITIENYDVRADLILGRVLLLRDNAFYGVLIVLAFSGRKRAKNDAAVGALLEALTSGLAAGTISPSQQQPREEPPQASWRASPEPYRSASERG